MIIDAVDISLEEIALTRPYSISYKNTSTILDKRNSNGPFFQ